MELRLRRETRPHQQPPASNPRKLMNILHPPFLLQSSLKFKLNMMNESVELEVQFC